MARGQRTLNLYAGWNLVDFGVENTPDNIFIGLTYYDDYTIYSWNAPGGPYNLEGPNDVLKDNIGHWVWLKEDITIAPSGMLWASRDIELVAGWNLVGFPVTNENTTPNRVFTGLNYYDNYYIYYWNAVGGPYIIQGPDQTFELGKGYWVYIDQDKTVTVP